MMANFLHSFVDIHLSPVIAGSIYHYLVAIRVRKATKCENKLFEGEWIENNCHPIIMFNLV